MSDLIKRSDAIKAVWGDDINPSEDGMIFEAQSHIDRDIRLIPSADRPQGEWKYHSNPAIWINPEDAFCSYCKYHIDTTMVDFDDYNFCPNCGARMKGADDE